MGRIERKMRVDETPSQENHPRARLKQAGCRAGGVVTDRGGCGLFLAPAQHPFSLQPPPPCHPYAWGGWEEAGLGVEAELRGGMCGGVSAG